jgi:molybdate transport system permease protein
MTAAASPSPDRWERLGGPLAYAYALALVALFAGLVLHLPATAWWGSGRSAELGGAVLLTLATSAVSTAIALAVAVPAAWRLSRRPIPGQTAIDVLIDLPLSLSPLVMGMAFLLFFASAPGRLFEQAATACGLPLRGAPAGVILGQTMIATAFAIRHLRPAFAAGDPAVATLGAACRLRRNALLVAATITWARTVGEFGPLLLFVGIVPGHSEVLSTAIYLSWTSGDLAGAAAAACVMILLSFVVMLLVRRLGRARS